jgi:hypothetical protein
MATSRSSGGYRCGREKKQPVHRYAATHPLPLRVPHEKSSGNECQRHKVRPREDGRRGCDACTERGGREDRSSSIRTLAHQAVAGISLMGGWVNWNTKAGLVAMRRAASTPTRVPAIIVPRTYVAHTAPSTTGASRRTPSPTTASAMRPAHPGAAARALTTGNNDQSLEEPASQFHSTSNARRR